MVVLTHPGKWISGTTEGSDMDLVVHMLDTVSVRRDLGFYTPGEHAHHIEVIMRHWVGGALDLIKNRYDFI